MRIVPVVVITGVAPDAMAAMTIALQWDLPNAVAVTHRIDADAGRLSRTVSDVTGVLEQADIDLEHACVSCAIREDIVPTLDRLAAAGRWDAIVVHLPVAAQATQVCRILAQERRLRHLRVAAVICAMDGARTVDDLLGDGLLRERRLHTADDDERGVGEACAPLVEYADAVTVVGAAGAAELDLLRALARPGAHILIDGEGLDPARLMSGLHDHTAAEAWVAEARRDSPPALDSAHVWRLDLVSDRPLHPDRLHEDIASIGGGPRRSRGCFWLPTRPGVVCGWDGAGGQLSIGATGRWRHDRPFTRIVVTGLDDGRDEIAAAFEHCLLSEAEARGRGVYWEAAQDGFENWLGDIRRTA